MNEMLNKKDVLDAIEKKMKVVNEADGDADVVLGLAAAMSVVKKMEGEPVNPTEKVGHWIDYQDDRWIYAKCSECGKVSDSQTDYCPYCGCAMEDVKE